MWARTAEVMLALWLAISPFVFAIDASRPLWWGIAFASATLVLFFSLLSFWRPARRAHVGTLITGVGLAGFGYFAAAAPSPPALQNFLITGLLLVMAGIIPSFASRPPAKWEQFYANGAD